MQTVVVLVLMFAGLLWVLLQILRVQFRAFGARFWATAEMTVGAGVVALGAALLWPADDDRVPVTCTVLSSQVEESGGLGGRARVLLRVAWTAEGQSRSLQQPSEHRVGPTATVDALQERFAAGRSIPCHVVSGRPNRVFFGRPAESLRRPIALSLMASGFAFAGIGGMRRRKEKPRRKPAPRGFQGLEGVAILVTALGGMALFKSGRPVPGCGLLASSLVFSVILIWRELRSADRVLAAVRAGMKRARYWPADPLPEHLHEGGSDLWADDRLQGEWRGMPVRVALVYDGAIAEVTLPGWPDDLLLTPSANSAAPPIGDDTFDALWSVQSTSSIWRIALSSGVRDILIELETKLSLTMEGPILKFSLSPDRVAELPTWLDRAADLSVAVAEASREQDEAAVLARSQVEPCAALRKSHYEWMLERGWETPLVLRTAAKDEDPTTRDWAKSQVPPQQGAYR